MRVILESSGKYQQIKDFIRLRIGVVLPLLPIIILTALACTASFGDVIYGTNLAPDPSFDSGASGWAALPQAFSVVDGTGHTGSKCLKETNTDPSSFDQARFVVAPAAPGAVYKFSVWAKPSNVTGSDTGATIAVYWIDSTGAYLDGKYLPGISGTADWTLISSETPPMPANAAKLVVIVYLGRSATGTAWFDDVDIHLKDDDLVFRPLLRYPNYRNTVFPGKPRMLAVGAEVKGNKQHPVSNLSILLSVLDSTGRVRGRVTLQTLTGKPWENLGVNTAKYPSGNYRAVVSLIDKVTGAVLVTDELPFTIAAVGTPLPKVYYDQYNRCIVDGKPFFPLGFYTSGSTETDWDQIKSMGFNCILDYGILSRRPLSDLRAYLDQIYARNLKVIFSVKDCYDLVPDQNPNPIQDIQYDNWNGAYEVFSGLVTSLKDHPAILAWYINDELTKGYLPQIMDRYNFIKSNDPNHPAYQVINTAEDPDVHMSYSDTLGIDVYPVLYQCEQGLLQPQLERTGAATDTTKLAGLNSRGIWMVPECSSQKSMTQASRPPTYQEVLCESYQSLVKGARGLVYYHFWELLHDDGPSQVDVMYRVAQNLHAIEPIILGIDAAPLKMLSASDFRISVLTRTVGSDIYALAVNPYNTTIPCTFKLGAANTASSIKSGLPGSTLSTVAVSNGSFIDSIEPYGVRVYKLASS